MTQHSMNTAHMYEQTVTKRGSCMVILPVERMIKKRTMFSISQGSVAHTCSVEMKKVKQFLHKPIILYLLCKVV